MDKIDSYTRNIIDDYFKAESRRDNDYSERPFIALAFKQPISKFHSHCIYKLELSSMEEPSKELVFWNAMLEELGKIRQDNAEDFRFKMRYVMKPSGTAFGLPAFMFLTLGESPRYGGNDSRDVVDAKYSVDGWGIVALEVGVKNEQRPFWSFSWPWA